ncbi:MAG: hypothetical protein SVR81_07285 [Chloroflexota bacterium]|nr:hypothetical protein [Chloroflexota bacterium]
MQIRIGLENNTENGRFLAYALDFPGAFAYGEDEAEALIRLPKALLEYDKWLRDHTPDPWHQLMEMDFRIEERFTTFNIDENYHLVPAGQGYQVKAWFLDDWRPLTEEEIDHALQIFHWQRDELIAGLSTLPEDVLEKQRSDQRWNINGIVKHVANAELWILSRLKLTTLSRADLFPDPVERLGQLAAQIDSIFPTFDGIVKVNGIDGEFWSYRKIVRRTLWHQRDHIEHIKQLVFGEQ